MTTSSQSTNTILIYSKLMKISKSDIIVIVPARYASTRFPGKPLALLAGEPVIIHVLKRITQAGYNCLAATDDTRIFNTVCEYGYKATMTYESHQSGTDRIREAYDNLTSESGREYKVVINVQGDEPFINGDMIDKLSECFGKDTTDIATLARPFPKDGDINDLENPNLVKLVKDSEGKALYFSRSVIPYFRGVEKSEWPAKHQYFTHIGIYGYRPDVLRKVTEMERSSTECAESLEQLRWLENGMTIMVGESDMLNVGIDTPEDLVEAERLINSRIRK